MDGKTRILIVAAGAAALLAGGPAAAQDKIRIGEVYNVTTLDPIRSASGANIATFGQLYSRLLRIDENGELAPGLGESWEVSDGGKTITLHMRDAQFSNGDPITAEDAAFSLTRALKDEASAYSAPLQSMDKAEAVDEKTLKVTLLYPFAPFLGNLEVFNTGIVSKKDVEGRGADEAFAEVPVSSGPYMVEQWIPNDRLELLPNPHYWREGFPKNGGVEIIEVPAENTRVSMILAGDLDVAREVPWSQVPMLKARDGISVPLEPSTAINMVQVNHSRPPFDDLKFRQAAAQAVDTNAFTQAMTFGNAVPANTTLPKALMYYDADLHVNPYDPEAAKKLLAESDYDGSEMVIMTRDNPEREKMAVLLQAQWAAIGIKSRIEKVDAATWWNRVEAADYDATPNWWYNETTDPDLAVRWALCGNCGNHSYYTFYDNDHLNDLIDKAARELDQDKRRDMYYEIQEITTRDVVEIPLYYPPFANAYSDRIEGVVMTPAQQWTLEGATIVK